MAERPIVREYPIVDSIRRDALGYVVVVSYSDGLVLEYGSGRSIFRLLPNGKKQQLAMFLHDDYLKEFHPLAWKAFEAAKELWPAKETNK